MGRTEIIADIARKLEDHRLVTAVCSGRIGKTTAARAVVEQVLPHLEHSVSLVDLSPLKEAGRVSSAIPMAVGITAHAATWRRRSSNACTDVRWCWC
ncbi:hypothetical protein [Novosphingobium kaempferiae]|uniref:hypothetical protein n=1 Tax=Novosphingobium kaempferiae TaxID=2896849 RepID=UPI001E62E873|nr:hypothetical protein [Novosphingobium kaempferiae]